MPRLDTLDQGLQMSFGWMSTSERDVCVFVCVCVFVLMEFLKWLGLQWQW